MTFPMSQSPIRDGETAGVIRWWSRFFKPVVDAINTPQTTDTGWIEPSYLGSGWSNYGGTWTNAAYRSKGGEVEFSGLVKAGASGLIFSLPAGFRPLVRRIFICSANGGIIRIDVDPNGTVNASVLALGATNTYVSLAMVRFVPGQ